MEKDFPTENDRRADIDQKLLKAGIDPDLISTNLLDDIYKLPDCHIDTLTGTFLWLVHEEFGDHPLIEQQLNFCLKAVLLHTKKMSEIL